MQELIDVYRLRSCISKLVYIGLILFAFWYVVSSPCNSNQVYAVLGFIAAVALLKIAFKE